MAREYELGVKGMESLVANFYKADAECQQALEEANAKGGEAIYTKTKRYTPVDTGFMRNHVRIDGTRFTWSVGWDADDFFSNGLEFYPEYVEFGTSRMAGRFPLTRAYEEEYPLHVERVSKAVKAAIERRNAR